MNATLRKECEQIQGEIDKATERLLKALKNQSSSKSHIEREVSLAFTASEDQIQRALFRVRHD